MNQVLHYIKIKESFAHKDSHIDFKPGRNYIIGNYGSGKSELLEMIGFAFFGSVSLRGKASTYPKLEVELKFSYLKDLFKIVRKTADATLYMYDEESEDYLSIATSTTGVNAKIISLIGYDYNIYVLSNYCQQGKLQYFSELTPAKRLQFIDKVSGIDDAEELLKWLMSKRKELKVTTDTLSSMIHQPELASDINLEFDYELELSKIVLDNSKINTLNDSIKKLQLDLEIVPPYPNDLNSDQIDLLSFGSFTIETYANTIQEVNNIFEKSSDLLNQIKNLKHSCPKSLFESGVTIEKAKEILQTSMINSLTTVDITCPSCNYCFDSDILKTKDTHIYTIKDLSNYIAWLESDSDSKIVSLTAEMNCYLNDANKLLEDETLNSLYNRYKSKMLLESTYKATQSAFEKREEIINKRTEIININRQLDVKIKEIQDDISLAITEHSVISNTRSELLRKKIEKELYKKQLDVFIKANDKYEEALKELNLIIDLIKEINGITTKIKLDTIPLINHHASNYLNIMTKGLMTDISITDTYDLIVDGHSINLRSGAQKDLASLAFRLSLGQSIILGMLPLFIGDEIDSSSPTEVATDIADALATMSDNGYQIILITHKDTTNLEDCNIIDLG